MVLVDIFGQMEENIVESGWTIKCTEQDCFNGVMEEFMLESIMMIKSMVKEYLNGIISIIKRPDGRKYVGYWLEGK